MKTSNVLLVGTLSVSILFIAAMPVLYNKALPDIGQVRYSKQVFKPGKVIKIENIADATLFIYDSLMIESIGNNVLVTNNTDTLKITGSDPMLIYVPRDHHVVAVNSRILLRGILRRLDAPSVTLKLNGSQLYSTAISRDTRIGHFLGHLTIIDDGKSVVDFKGVLGIDKLTLREVANFSCSGEVGIGDTDFVFDKRSKVWARSCMEGLFIDSN